MTTKASAEKIMPQPSPLENEYAHPVIEEQQSLLTGDIKETRQAKWKNFCDKGWEAGARLAPWPVFEKNAKLSEKVSRWFDWVLNMINLATQIMGFFPPLFITSAIVGLVIGLIGGTKTFLEVMFSKEARSKFQKGAEGFASFTSFALNVAGAVMLKTSGPWSLAFNIVTNLDNIITGTVFLGIYFYNGLKALGAMIKSGWDYLFFREKPVQSDANTKMLSTFAVAITRTSENSPKTLQDSSKLLSEDNSLSSDRNNEPIASKDQSVLTKEPITAAPTTSSESESESESDSDSESKADPEFKLHSPKNEDLAFNFSLY